jgi:co-chaperonin GroES (HSP10)
MIPLNDYVLLEQVDAPETTASGLIITTAATDDNKKLKVVNFGSLVSDTFITVGSFVYVDWNKVHKVKSMGKSYAIIKAEYVLAVE